MSDFIVCAYFTLDTRYAQHALRLTRSLQSVGVRRFDVQGIPNSGSWHANMQHKPTFCRQKLQQWQRPIVYVDADAEFCRYPDLFHTLTGDIAAHLFDRSLYQPRPSRKELLSGTLWLNYTPRCLELVDRWVEMCSRDPRLWDQKALQRVLENSGTQFTELPAEYCMIFDTMSKIQHPVIRHYQASREFRQHGMRVPDL